MWLQGARLTVDTETLSDETNRIVDSRSGTGSAANPSEVSTEKIFGKPTENIYNMLHFSQRTCRKLNNWFRTARTMAL